MQNTKREQQRWKSYRFPIILLAGIIAGSFIGYFNPELGKQLKPLGDIFLNLVFSIVVPVVFFSISSAVASMADMKRLGKILGYMIVVFFPMATPSVRLRTAENSGVWLAHHIMQMEQMF